MDTTTPVRRRLASLVAILLTWMQAVPPAAAAEFRVFRKTYTRQSGPPVTVTDAFTVLQPATAWTLRAINGSLEDTSVEKVSSSVVALNGTDVLQPQHFSQNVSVVEAAVTLKPTNTIATQLRGQIGGQLTVELLRTDSVAPTAAWHAPTAGQLFNTATVAASLRLTDDVAGLDPASVAITLDGTSVRSAFSALTQPALAATLTASLSPPEGPHTLTASVKDLAGQPAVAQASFTVDRTPPVISALTPADGATVDTARPVLSAQYADVLSGIDTASVRILIDDVDRTAQAAVTATGVSLTLAQDLAEGAHGVEVRVADVAGNPASQLHLFTVQTLRTPPITAASGFIHGQVFNAMTQQPMAGVLVTARGVTGQVRTDAKGTYAFPTPGTGTFILNHEIPGFTSAQRVVEVLSQRDAAAEPVFLTPLDAAVTPISRAEGGRAADSSGNFEVVFPPEAAPRDLHVRVTPLARMDQLPGPIPDGRAHVAAVYFEPRFTNFDKPATLRARNAQHLPSGTTVPLSQWNEDTQQWMDAGSGTVTADGQWVEFPIIRFFCWYCIWMNRIVAARAESPQQPSPTTSGVANPTLSCDVHDQSAVCMASGNLSESHTLPALRTLGAARALRFTYRSLTASPSVLVGTDYAFDPLRDGVPIPTPATTTAAIQIEGRLISASFAGASGALRQAALWDGRNARGELVPTGAYPYTVNLSNDYDATLGGTGVPAMDRAQLATPVRSRAIVVNERASAFGAGWSLEGLERLWPQPDGTVLLTDGDGAATVFRPGPQADLAVLSADGDDVSVFSGHGDGTFQPLQRVVVGPVDLAEVGGGSVAPLSIAAGDFNEDGFQDLAATLSNRAEVAITLGQGRATFGAATPFAVDANPTAVAVADCNRDGHDDLAVLSGSSNAVDILLGNGDGTFQPKRVLAIGSTPQAMVVGDLTRDGIPDLVTVNAGSQDATVLVGVGDGTFRPAVSPPVGRSPVAVALGDFNNDGRVDVLAANSLDAQLSLLLGNGDGTFQPRRLVQLRFQYLKSLAIGDFNGDGRSDVATQATSANSVTVLLGNGDGTFTFLPDVSVGQGPAALVAGDLNQDGRLDLAVANAASRSVSYLLGHGDGTFRRQQDLGVGFTLISLVLGEFDDRRGDLDRVFSGLPGDFSRLRQHPDGTFSRQLTDGTRLLFDARGVHTRTVDRNGNETRYTYDAQDRLTRVAFPGGAAFDLTYSAGRLASVTDSSGRITQFLVSGTGDLQRIANPDGTARQFAYDAEHRLTSQTNERVDTTDYVYDAFGRIQEARLPARPIMDATGAVSSQREIRRFAPAQSQGLINTLPAGLGTPSNPAPPVPTPVSVFQDGLGHTTRMATDAFGAPTTLIDALSRTTLTERDINGLPARITRPNGSQILFRYDSRGNTTVHVQRIPAATGFTPLITKFAYEPRFSRLTKITDARRDSPFEFPAACVTGCVTTFGYDEHGNLTTMTDGLGNVTGFTYDARGLLVSATDALGMATPAVPDDHQTRFAYEATTGNLLSTTDAINRTTSLAYDTAGQVTASTDAAGRVTRFTYDPMGRLLSVQDALTQTTRYAYDAGGNLTAVTDATNHITRFTYDSLNLLASTTNALHLTTQFAYDATRQLARLEDAKGQTLRFAYDAAGQLVTKTLADAAGQVQDTVTYAYDATGNLIRAQDADSLLRFTYDGADRLLTAQTGDASTPALAQPVTRLESSYDKAGHRVALSGATAIGQSYAYDAANRLTGVSNGQFGGASFTYDAAGRLLRQVSPGIPTTFTYDDAGQLLTLSNTLLGAPLNTVAYTYDPRGNRTSLTDRLGVHDYRYDPLSRLLSATHPAASQLPTPETFTYDALGNRLSAATAPTWTYDAGNRLLSDGTCTYTYDANGNQTTKTDLATGAVTRYTYDVENQLMQLDLPTGDRATYRSDALGRRSEKAITHAGTTTTQRFVYDHDDLVSTYDATGCWQGSVTYAGLDRPVAFLRDDSGNCGPGDAVGFREQVRYPQADALGSIVSVVSETAGFVRGLFVAERVSYSAFGTPRLTTPGPDGQFETADDVTLSASASGNPFLFTGREYDPESGLYYYRRRYYDPGIGRFINRDPLGEAAGVNLYTYVDNNPLNWIDPFGLEKDRPWWDWYVNETVVPGPRGQPLSEWGPEGPTSWGDPLQYTEAAGGPWMWAERAALGTATVATVSSAAGLAVPTQSSGVCQLSGFTKHGINQVISRGISPAAVLQALNDPKFIAGAVDELGRVTELRISNRNYLHGRSEA